MFSKLYGIVGCVHRHSINRKKQWMSYYASITYITSTGITYYMFWGMNYQSTDGVQITYRFHLNYQGLVPVSHHASTDLI